MGNAWTVKNSAKGAVFATKDPVRVWFDTAGRYQPLAKSEVTRHAKIIQNPESSEAERKKSADKLFKHNMLLVGHTTKKFITTKTNLHMWDDRVVDYLQSGLLGLHTAVYKYDPEKGFTFSTYAVRWINQKLGRYHITQWGIMHVPEAVVLMTTNPEHKGREKPSSRDRIDSAIAARSYFNLDRSYSSPGSTSSQNSITLGDLIPDNNTDWDPEDVAITNCINEFHMRYPEIAADVASGKCGLSKDQVSKLLMNCW
jgi:DNA-directed RNA polymerase sigma subunit (sigma70/sigma32)